MVVGLVVVGDVVVVGEGEVGDGEVVGVDVVVGEVPVLVGVILPNIMSLTNAGAINGANSNSFSLNFLPNPIK